MFGKWAQLVHYFVYVYVPIHNKVEEITNKVEENPNRVEASNKDRYNIQMKKTLNRVNIFHQILLISGSFCGYHPY